MENTVKDTVKSRRIAILAADGFVLDRAGLEATTCDCYGTIRAEYDRLVGGMER